VGEGEGEGEAAAAYPPSAADEAADPPSAAEEAAERERLRQAWEALVAEEDVRLASLPPAVDARPAVPRISLLARACEELVKAILSEHDAAAEKEAVQFELVREEVARRRARDLAEYQAALIVRAKARVEREVAKEREEERQAGVQRQERMQQRERARLRKERARACSSLHMAERVAARQAEAQAAKERWERRKQKEREEQAAKRNKLAAEQAQLERAWKEVMEVLRGKKLPLRRSQAKAVAVAAFATAIALTAEAEADMLRCR
jgi:hypothetical protein